MRRWRKSENDESDYVQMSWKRNDERFERCSERNRVGDLN